MPKQFLGKKVTVIHGKTDRKVNGILEKISEKAVWIRTSKRQFHIVFMRDISAISDFKTKSRKKT